ncbi:MAG: M23 family metallopeptidase [Clostridiaceae bacterium]|nr:M23 family metallopeptidase [Clostridiaceae bacterium]
MKKEWKRLLAAGVLMLFTCVVLLTAHANNREFIRYAEFNVPYAALDRALADDIACKGKVSWIDVLACLAAKYGGEWKRYKAADMDALHEQLHGGETIESITQGMQYFSYFRQVYGAVLGGFVGWHLQELKDDRWEIRYGLTAYSPLAEGYWYNDFDDFGASRSYGFKRRHLGHDMMGSVGTPVIAVECGTVEALGWNQYGGWRIGIRSRDGKRYYYYAHLRKDHPFAEGLAVGQRVMAGDVIGYLGQTGYSHRENVNGIETPHLHYGLELVFDESQKESDNEIWVDLYAITRLLERHRATVHADGKEYVREYEMLLFTPRRGT